MVRYSIDFLSSVPLPSLRRYAPVLSIHSLRKGRWGVGGGRAEDDVYVTILTPFVRMEKAWKCEAARRQRGIEFARLRLQDEL